VAALPGRLKAQEALPAGSVRMEAAPAAFEVEAQEAEPLQEDHWDRDPAPRKAVITPRQVATGIRSRSMLRLRPVEPGYRN
jgi:hypothetical protein